MPNPLAKMKNLVRGEDEESGLVADIKDDCPCCASLSWETRIKGFIACFTLGIVLSIVGIILVFTKKYTAFGVVYSLGTVTGLTSSLFLSGPVKQIKRMFEEKRIIATLIVFLMLTLTLCAALWWKNGILTLLFAFFQFLAMTWYCLSYIPYARTAVTKCCTACLE